VKLELDHVVLAARNLTEGVEWCEATLGITPAPGGRHALMGTHNHLFSIASERFARAYFEIIAIDPDAPAPGRARWFDLDQDSVANALRNGPALIHWVARCDDAQAASRALAAQGVDAGEWLAAERATAQGVLRWRITVRGDGRRLFDGAWPTLIEWRGVHPADALPHSGVELQSLSVGGLPASLAALLPSQVAVDRQEDATPIKLTLATPRGRVTLAALHLEA
jgi:hypothetical protein